MLTIPAASLRSTSNDATHPPAATVTHAPEKGAAGFASLLRQRQALPPASAPTPAAAPAAAPAPAMHTPAPEPASATGAPADATPPSQAVTPKNAARAEAAPASASTAEAASALEANTGAELALKGKLRLSDLSNPGDPRGARGTEDPAADVGSASAPVEAAPAKSDTPLPATTLPADAPLPMDPTVMHWLAGLQRATAATPAPATAPATALTTRAADGTTVAARPNSATDALETDAGGTRPPLPGVQAGDGKEKQAPDAARASTTTGPDRFAAMLAEQRVTELRATPAEHAVTGPKDTTAPVPALAAGSLAPPLAAQAAAPAPAALTITTPVTAPEFPQALGLQMSVLARDGVQHAELQLNPAEMGPVSVRIVMDGTQARVDFGADLAATRQAIEAGLPELASALRDAGFTLAGGGVSQHSAGGRREGEAPAKPGTRRTIGAESIDPIDVAQRASRRTVSLGGLDLYA